MSTALNGTPISLSTSTVAAEKPHIGKRGVPFMYTTTGFSFTSLSISASTSLIGRSPPRLWFVVARRESAASGPPGPRRPSGAARRDRAPRRRARPPAPRGAHRPPRDWPPRCVHLGARPRAGGAPRRDPPSPPGYTCRPGGARSDRAPGRPLASGNLSLDDPRARGFEDRMGPAGSRSRTSARRLRPCKRVCMYASPAIPRSAGGAGFESRQSGTSVAATMIVMQTVRLLLILVAARLVFVAPAGATTANDICQGTDDPCVVNVVRNGVTVTPGSVLDFGNRTLRVPPGAQLVVSPPGSMTVKAGAVDIQATSQGAGSLRAVGGSVTLMTTGDVSVHKLWNSTARIDVSGDPTGGAGGDIDIESTAGNVLVDGVLAAGANAADGDGGSVTLMGMTVAIGSASEIDVNGKGAGAGGMLTIDSASNLTMGGKIDGSGGDFDAGEIDLGVGGNLVSTANIDLQSTQGGGNGGTLTVGGSVKSSFDSVGGSATFGGSINL